MHIYADFWATESKAKVRKMPSFHYCKGCYITLSSTLGKIEQTLHQSDIEYNYFIYSYVTDTSLHDKDDKDA